MLCLLFFLVFFTVTLPFLLLSGRKHCVNLLCSLIVKSLHFIYFLGIGTLSTRPCLNKLAGICFIDLFNGCVLAFIQPEVCFHFFGLGRSDFLRVFGFVLSENNRTD